MDEVHEKRRKIRSKMNHMEFDCEKKNLTDHTCKIKTNKWGPHHDTKLATLCSGADPGFRGGGGGKVIGKGYPPTQWYEGVSSHIGV